MFTSSARFGAKVLVGLVMLATVLFGIPLTSVTVSAQTAETPSGIVDTSGGSGTPPELSTDKADYLPGQTATIFGKFFSVFEDIAISIFGTNEDGSAFVGPVWTVTTNDVGAFTTAYTLENVYRPLYTVVANALSDDGSLGDELARTTFTDGPPKASLEQCRNGAAGSPNDCVDAGGGTGWVSGNVGASQGHLREGYSIPYRLVFKDLPTGTPITVELGYDIKHSGKHAIDFLTHYDRLEPHDLFGHSDENVDPTSGVSGISGTITTFPIPAPSSTGSPVTGEPTATFNALPSGEREMTLFGGTITAMSNTANGDLNAAQSESRISVTFTVDSSVAVLAWGGHIATQATWGAGNSAVGISGSPYHMRKINWNLANFGNEDRSLSADVILQPGTIIIDKVTDPADSTESFTFTTTGTGYVGFSLTDAAAPNAQSLQPGTYSVAEASLPTGWSQTSAVCVSSLGNAETAGALSLQANETITCTFTNTLSLAHLTLVKEVVNDNGGGALPTAWTLSADGVTDISGVTGNTAVTDALVEEGVYTLSEFGGPSGYTAGTYSCVVNGGAPVSGNTLALLGGDIAVCTITNNDIAPQLTVIKHVINDEDGTLDAGDFTMTITGSNLSDASFAGSEEPGTTVTLNQGAYSVDETDSFGYTKTMSADCSGSIAVGESKTCTITNNDVNILPSVAVVKTAGTTSMPEPGGPVLFTVEVTNTSAEPVTLTSLVDDIYGDLNGEGTCATGGTIASGATYTCAFTGLVVGEPGLYTDVVDAVVTDNELSTATDEDDASVTLTNVLPSVEIVKSANPTTLPEPGGIFTFTLTITNTSIEPVTITALTDTYALPSACTDLLGDILAPDASTSCNYDVTHTDAGTYDNTASVTVTDNENTTATDEDDETVTVTDVLPTVTLVKLVDDNEKPEPGGTFNYTLTITNTSVEEVTITDLADSNDLSAECNALVGTTLVAGASASCGYSVAHSDAGTYPNTANVTVADDEANTASDSDDETVTVTNVLPTVTIVKSANPTTLPEPGGVFTFTLIITNTSVEPVTITDLGDTNVLSQACLDLIGDVLPVGGFTSCTYDVTHTNAGTYPNTADVTVTDDEETTASAEDDETVTVLGATIAIDPLTATNNINDPHTFTVTVMENDGSGWVAAAGEHIDFTLTDGNGATSVLNAAASTCDDIGANTNGSGECMIVLNSVTPGTVTIHATSDVSVGSETIHRETDSTLGSSEDAVKTYVAGALKVTKAVEGLDAVVNSGAVNDTFTVTVTGPSYPNGEEIVFTVTNGVLVAPATVTLDPVIPGAYTITEADAGAEWTESVPANAVVVTANQTAEGVVTNTYVSGSLEVEKVVDLNGYLFPNGVDLDFSIEVSGPSYPTPTTLTFNVVDGVASDAQTLAYLIPGAYTVTEVGAEAAAWTVSGGGAVNVSAGAPFAESAVTNDLKLPSTTITMTPSVWETTAGGNVELTITDTNDGAMPLSNASVELYANNVLTIPQPTYVSGDTNANNIMDIGETWVWTVTLTISENTVFTVNGIGTDLLGNPVNGPTYASESTAQTVKVLGTTRTIGFWQTHTTFTNYVFQNLMNGSTTVGSAPSKGTVTNVTLAGQSELYGGFYASLTHKAGGGKRNPLDQARMQLLQQLLAAKLNCAAFGCSAVTLGQLASADAVYASGTRGQILAAAAALDLFNNSGDANAIPPALPATGKATPTLSKSLANYAFWDNP